MVRFHIRTGHNAPDSPGPRGSPPSVGSQKPLDTPRSSCSPRIEVGEIDTRAPFQSVKAAVSLFGEAGSSPKVKPVSRKPENVEERVLEKETQLHLSLKELHDFRARLRVTESTKAQAHRELEKANRTLQELTSKLETVSESKQIAIETTECAKQRAAELEEHKSSREQVAGDAWRSDVDSEREEHKASAAELVSAKQELTSLRQDFDAALEAKLAAFQQAADAQHSTQVSQKKVTQLSREITNLREALGHVKIASLQAQEEQEKHDAESLGRLESHKKAKEVEENIKSLKEESDPEVGENLEEKLEETTEAIKVLQEQLNNVRDSDLSSWALATSELDEAKKTMQEILEEENSLRSLADVLKLELDNVKQEQSELKNKACEAESAAENLQTDLQKIKTELEAALAGKTDPQDAAAHDMQMKIQQLSSEAENVRQEAKETKKNVASLEKKLKPHVSQRRMQRKNYNFH